MNILSRKISPIWAILIVAAPRRRVENRTAVAGTGQEDGRFWANR
jgi:hypothetical protein